MTAGRRVCCRRRILILGLTPLAERLVREIEKPGRRVVVGIVDDRPAPPHSAMAGLIVGPFRRLREIVAELRPNCIVVALVEKRGTTPLPAILDSCLPRGVTVEDGAEFYERLTGKLPVESLAPASLAYSRRFPPSGFQRVFARVLSLPVAIVGLVTLWPLMIAIALAIKLESPGPVVSVQQRFGANRRPFRLLSFRTVHRHKAEQLTRVGRWLRAWRLDHLPQLINVVRGEMNLVGPRPHPVTAVDLLTVVARNLSDLTGVAVGYYGLRSMVAPGVTGWAQVRFGTARNLEEEIEKLRFDLYYVKHASPWLDLRILLETLKVIVSRRQLATVERMPSAEMADDVTRTPVVFPAPVISVGTKVDLRWLRGWR